MENQTDRVSGKLRGLITPLHSYANALRAGILLAPATERQQIEPRAALVAGEPGNDRAGAIQADEPFVIAEFRADASGKFIGVGGRFRRKVGRPELNVQVERSIRRRHHLI